MPAKNPVIAVVVPREVNAVVTRLAALRGVSKSAVVRDFLIETTPVLERVANMLDLAARTDRTALKEWAKTLEASQTEAEKSATALLAGFDDAQRELELLKPGRPPAGADRKRTRSGRPGRAGKGRSRR